MSLARWGADVLEGFNPFAELEERKRLKEQERQRQERQRQEQERREREEFNRRLIRADMDQDVERARIMAGQTFQFGQAGADRELGRELTRSDNNTTNATKVIGAAIQGKVDTIGAGYQGEMGLERVRQDGQGKLISTLGEINNRSQTSKQDWVKEILDGYQAHERGVLGDLVGRTPALEQINSTYLAGLDRTIAADERLQAAERPLRWAGLVLPTTAALAAALIK